MSEVITSLQNANIKLAASLKLKKYRDVTGLFVAEGIRLAEEVVKSAWEVQFALFLDTLLNERALKLMDTLEKEKYPVYRVNRNIYEKVSDTKESQGILLVVKKRQGKLSDVLRNATKPNLVVLDALQDPGNVGTIIRTADAAGCSGVILMKGSADVFNNKTVRSAMGSLFHLPIITDVSEDELMTFLQAHHIASYAAALDKTAKICFTCDFTQAFAVIFGNEGNGVRPSLLSRIHEKLFIPMQGSAESLNVATAAAVIIYENLRQRMATKS